MESFINYSTIATGIWLVSMGTITKAEGWLAGMIFKLIPVLLGLSCLFSGLKLIGWI